MSAAEWYPMHTAPQDGTPIIGRIDGQPVIVRRGLATDIGGYEFSAWVGESPLPYEPDGWLPLPPTPTFPDQSEFME